LRSLRRAIFLARSVAPCAGAICAGLLLVEPASAQGVLGPDPEPLGRLAIEGGFVAGAVEAEGYEALRLNQPWRVRCAASLAGPIYRATASLAATAILFELGRLMMAPADRITLMSRAQFESSRGLTVLRLPRTASAMACGRGPLRSEGQTRAFLSDAERALNGARIQAQAITARGPGG